MKERDGKRYKLYIACYYNGVEGNNIISFENDSIIELRRIKDIYVKQYKAYGFDKFYFFITKWNSKEMFYDTVERGECIYER